MLTEFQVLAALGKEVAHRKREIRKWYANSDRLQDKLASVTLRNVMGGLDYRPRLKLFKTSNGKLDFDPATGLGHSYEWYEISKVIKGKLILNIYRYSSTTNKHVRRLAALFRTLRLDFIEVQAPSGLQNLATALAHAKSEYGKYSVKAKFGRKGNWQSNVKWSLEKIKTLEKLSGLKVSKSELTDAVTYSKENRIKALQNKARFANREVLMYG